MEIPLGAKKPESKEAVTLGRWEKDRLNTQKTSEHPLPSRVVPSSLRDQAALVDPELASVGKWEESR